MLSDGLLSAAVNEEDDEILSMPRFKEFYEQYLKEKNSLSSAVHLSGMKDDDGEQTDWYIIPLKCLKDIPKTEK